MLSNLKMFANIIKQMVRRDPYLESGLSDKIPAKNRDLTYFDLVPSALPTPTGTRVHKFGYIPPYIPPAITNAVQRPHTMKVLSRKTNADLRLKIDPDQPELDRWGVAHHLHARNQPNDPLTRYKPVERKLMPLADSQFADINNKLKQPK